MLYACHGMLSKRSSSVYFIDPSMKGKEAIAVSEPDFTDWPADRDQLRSFLENTDESRLLDLSVIGMPPA